MRLSMLKRLVKNAAARGSTRTVSALLILLCGASAAQAADYCVRCTNPDQTYRCHVTGVGHQYSDAVKLFCVLKTTKEEGHAKCTASVDASCQGIDKVYAYNGPDPSQLIEQRPEVQRYREQVARQKQKFEPEEDRKTLFDLGKGMFGASKRGIDSAKTRMGYGSDGTPEPQALPSPTTVPPARQAAPPPPVAPAPAAPSQPPPQAATAQAPQSEESWGQRSYRCVRSFFFNCGADEN